MESTVKPNHSSSADRTASSIMFLKCLLLAALVGVALASHYHHSHDYHGDGHHGYHHMSHHGYHGQHGDGYHGVHNGYGQHGSHHGHGYHDHHDYQHDNINYKFKYDVKDDKTYNYQSRDEYKDGKNVYGSYSLVQPDGKIRVVNYKADGYGFQADVDYKGDYKHDYKPSYGHHDHY